VASRSEGAARGRRHGVTAFAFGALFLGYTDRVNLAVAAVAMRTQLHWSQSAKGLVLAGFFVGYLLFQVVSGSLAQRFGGKRVLTVAVLWWSLCALLTPLAAVASVAVLVAARIGLGLGEAAVLPACYDLFSRWIPAGERGRAVGRFMCGIPLGQIAGLALTGYLTARAGWPASFYLFGALGLLWALAFVFRVHNDPARDPAVSPAERARLPDAAPAGAMRTPWGPLLRSPLVRAFIGAHFCHNWALYILISWLPSYFSEHLGLTLAQAGLFAALPWATNFLALLIGGFAGDTWVARGAPLLTVRRLMAAAGLAGTALALLALSRAVTPAAALTLTCTATAALGIALSGFVSVPLDITPRHAPMLIGLSNTLATLPGIAGVAITGWLLDETHSYAATFLMTAAITTAGAVALLVTRSAPPALAKAAGVLP
jgi:MFS transporter, ACS family, solute carrier family 17 (sodium-dependent inorganic phosphate cotransporter), other